MVLLSTLLLQTARRQQQRVTQRSRRHDQLEQQRRVHAVAARRAGNAAFAAGSLTEAYAALSRGVLILVQVDVPIVDFGMAPAASTIASHQPLAVETKELLASILSTRAAAAIRLGRPYRALADSEIRIRDARDRRTAEREAAAALVAS